MELAGKLNRRLSAGLGAGHAVALMERGEIAPDRSIGGAAPAAAGGSVRP